MIKFFLNNKNLLLVGFLTAFGSGFGQTYFISLFGGYFRNLLDLTNGEFGSLYSAATMLSAISLIWAGKLIDNVALKKYIMIIIFGFSLTCLLTSSVSNVYILFICLFFLRFFGQGLMGHTSRTTMARYFNQNRGKALAISSYGLAFGEMVYPLLAVLFIGLMGWRYTWLSCSIMLLVFFGSCFWVLLKNHNKRHEEFIKSQKNDKNISWRRRDVLSDIKFYCYLPSSLLTGFALTGFFFHQVHIATLKSWNLSLIAFGLFFYAVFSIIGSTISGFLIDKFKARTLMPYFLLPLIIIFTLLIYNEGPVILFIYMSWLGFTQALAETISGALWAELYGVNNLGSIKALMTFFGVLASAASPFLFGFILDQGNTLNLLIVGTIITIIVCSLLSYLGKYFK